MPLRLKLLLAVLLTLIIAAHIGLWRDPDMTYEAKRNWTAINALSWAVIILPLFAVNQWLKTHSKAKPRKPDEPSP